MPHSYAETLSLACAACGRDFEAEFWLVVDTTERPDLLERIRAGTLHDLACPHCGDAGHMDAPLLLYQPDAEPAILFSPAEEIMPDENQEQAQQLLEMLQQSLGNDWQDAWQAEGPTIVPRTLLPALLGDDPEAAMRQMAEQAAAQLERLRQEDPDRFRELEDAARQQQAPMQVLTEAGTLGQHLIELLNASGWEEAHKIVESHSDLLSAELDVLIDRLLAVEERPQAHQLVETWRRLLARCREVGVERAFEEATTGSGLDVPPQFRNDLQQAIEAEQRYLHTGQRTALDAASDAWERVLNHPTLAGGDVRFQLAVMNSAGRVFLRRYWAAGRLFDLNRALQVWQSAVGRTPPDSPDLPDYLNNLGTALRERYACIGDLQDLAEAIRVSQQAIEHIPPDSPVLPGYLNNLGNGLRVRYARTGDLQDLAEAIRVSKQAIERTPLDSPDLPSFLSNLSIGLRVRYARTGDLQDLAEAIRVSQQAIERAPRDSSALPSFLNNLGLGLHDRYTRIGDLQDLAEAIRSYQQAIERTPPDSPDLPMYLNSLGTGLRDRYTRTGDLQDLAEAIRVSQQAIERTPRDSPALPSFLNNLGNGLRVRYARTGDLRDLAEAIRISQQVIERTPPDSPDLPICLKNLSIGLHVRYTRTGDPRDLAEAIRVSQQAIRRTPPDSPHLPGLLNNLGLGLRDRYARIGDLQDLALAIRSYQQAIEHTPPDSPDLPSFLSNLSIGLRVRYTRTGDLQDLAEAIRVSQQAIERTPRDSSALPSFLNNLGNGLRHRYARIGDLQDLAEAIRSYQQAIERTPPDSPDLPSSLNNLSIGLRARYTRTGDLQDLAEAIRVSQQAVQHTPRDSPVLPGYLNNLGIGLRDRYARTGDLQDLAEAIRVSQEALEHIPPDSPDLPGYLNNLGNGLGVRYARTGDLQDLAEAILSYQQAIERTPLDSPDLPSFLSNLGTGLRKRYARTGALADMEEARERYRAACKRGQEVTPEEALRSARNWGNWALQRRDWLEASEAYAYSRQAIDLLFATQTSRAAKESWLREAQGLPANAAYALARLDRLEEAVKVLEAGRARLLAEALEATRRDLERLPELGHGNLLARYQAASDRLALLQAQAAQPAAPHNLPQEREAARHDLDAAIAAIRQVPGYDDFFLAPSFDKIQGAATPGAPLVYLATTSAGSVALVVRAHKPGFSEKPGLPPVSVVWLDGFTNDDLDALLVERQDGQVTGGYLPGQLGDHEALNASLAQALPRLGQELMGPLAAHLREQGVTGVALAPAGRLSLLPLHAAHYVVDGLQGCFLDEFSVRYTPSATALAAAYSEARRRDTPLLLAGVGNPLPDLATGAWASQRAQAILARLPAAPSNASLNQAREILQAVASASPQEAIRAGDLLIAAVRILALGGAALELVLAALEIVQRIPPSLDYAEAELRSVLDLLPGNDAWTAYGQEATRDALWQALPAATWLHLACHGQFNPQEPLDSALLLAAGSRITLRELLDRQQSAALAGLRLVFLSACQTAITDFDKVPDEAIGLPAGFLQAGIPAVVGTLWPVNDASTALLATRFYELHLHGDPRAGRPPQSPAKALQRAQHWLRDVTNTELAEYLDSHRRLKEASEQEKQQRMSWALIKETRREVRRAVRDGQGDARPYAAAYHWAPFVFYGAG